MPKLRIYKEFYRINVIDGVNDNYTLIDPYSISAETVDFNTNSFVENLNVVQESMGNYYVEITPSLYTFPNIYQFRWYVQYLNNGITKLLRTKFIFDPITQNIITELEIELYNNALTYEICHK